MARKEKKEVVAMNISVPQEIIKKIEEGKYNKNKLIVSLLEKFLSKNQK